MSLSPDLVPVAGGEPVPCPCQLPRGTAYCCCPVPAAPPRAPTSRGQTHANPSRSRRARSILKTPARGPPAWHVCEPPPGTAWGLAASSRQAEPVAGPVPLFLKLSPSAPLPQVINFKGKFQGEGVEPGGCSNSLKPSTEFPVHAMVCSAARVSLPCSEGLRLGMMELGVKIPGLVKTSALRSRGVGSSLAQPACGATGCSTRLPPASHAMSCVPTQHGGTVPPLIAPGRCAHPCSAALSAGHHGVPPHHPAPAAACNLGRLPATCLHRRHLWYSPAARRRTGRCSPA